MTTPTEFGVLAFSFFREFARCEYCLKAVGLLEGFPSKPQADWGIFGAGDSSFTCHRIRKLKARSSTTLLTPQKNKCF